MRKGDHAKLLFAQNGEMLGFATGSDACTEHECGSKRLLAALCAQDSYESLVIETLRRGAPVLSRCATPMDDPEAALYPDLLTSKRIVKTPKDLRFKERNGETPEAILSCCYDKSPFDHPELQYSRYVADYDDPNVVGAWCESEFALRVRGADYVAALRHFHQAMLEGRTLFAGTFLQHSGGENGRMSGVIIANEDHLNDDHRAAIKVAQLGYERGLRLKARDDSSALLREMGSLAGGRNPGYLWAQWQDDQESAVVYGLNPGFGVKADYLGPYRREQLLAWAKSGYAYQLSRKESQSVEAGA